jgi:DNA polymerase
MNLFWDIETRSTCDLEVAGAWRYAADPATEILCVGYAVDDGPVQTWAPGQPVPVEFTAPSTVVAHNVQFERAVAIRILQSRHGWPAIPIARHRCTMAMALASAMPGALESVAAILGLPPKDAEGAKLMKRMARPRRHRKGEDPDQIYWVDGPDLREQLHQYCKQDVELTRAIFRRLPTLSAAEQELWELDALINERGFAVDVALTLAARAVAREESAGINAEIAKLTGGAITSVNQVAKISAFIRDRGHQLKSLNKHSVAGVLAHDPGDEVQQLLELRQDGARASARKLDRLLHSVDTDGRLRGTLRYHGASTGRWSGRGFQPQNLKKTKLDIGAAVDAIMAGDIDRIRALGAPLVLAGEISRGLIVASEGHVLMGADFSAIESRVLAWLAGEDWKTDTYRRFDATGDVALEPYCVTATRVLRRSVTPEDDEGRQIGKTCDLAFGYGGGLGAWRRFDTSDTYTDSEVERFKADWRREHAATVQFWHALERAAHRAIRTGQPVKFNRFQLAMGDGTLFLTLPSGRRLAYPEARLVPGRFDGTRQIRCKDNAQGAWADRDAWYGTLTENVVQAIARDLLAAALQRLDAAGYRIVLHVHDEAVAEVPEGFGSESEFLELMLALPDWADGLPIAAKPWRGKRYAKPGKVAATPENDRPGKVTGAFPRLGPCLDAPLNDGFSVAREDDGESEREEINVSLVDLIGQPLVDGKVRCPFHEDGTPSCHIYPDHFHCFSCDAHGDHVDWLMQADGLSREQAIEQLANWDGPVAPQSPVEDDTRTLKSALQIWQRAKPIAGTLAADYLTSRGIDLAMLPADVDQVLRFHGRCPFGSGTRRPCLVALLRDVATDAPAGIHRIALPTAWAPGVKVERQLLGRWPTPRAVKLWPATSSLVIGEGIETVLAAATRIPYRGAPLQPAWAAISAGALGQFPAISGIERLVLLVDHDEAGQANAARCAQRWRRTATVIKLTPGTPDADFNNVIPQPEEPTVPWER